MQLWFFKLFFPNIAQFVSNKVFYNKKYFGNILVSSLDVVI